MAEDDQDCRLSCSTGSLLLSNLRRNLVAASFELHSLNGGEVWVNDNYLADGFAQETMTSLLSEVKWEQPVVRMGGYKFQSPRLSAWFGDPTAIYTYSGSKYLPQPWNQTLLNLRSILDTELGLAFNSVLLNYYRDGNDSMGWHQDNERELGPSPAIVSLSLGESRRFLMKHIKNKDDRWRRVLTNGSALVMLGETQRWWKHCLPKTKVHQKKRINLTFRQILES